MRRLVAFVLHLSNDTAGNDLARCLNWGGGLYAMREKGLPAVLRDIEHTTVALLDRWEVTITRTQAEKQSLAANQLQRMSSLVARERPDSDQQVFAGQISAPIGLGVSPAVSSGVPLLWTPGSSM
jgi:hypothetical protein